MTFMGPPQPISLRLLALATIAAVLSVTLGLLSARRQFDALRTLRDAPIATLDQPRAGPARYRGVLNSTSVQTTPTGTPAPIWWWYLTVRSNKSRRAVCNGHSHADLVLEENGRSMPIAFVNQRTVVSLLADDRDWDFDADAPTTVDVGPHREIVPPTRPVLPSHCTGREPEYRERFIRAGSYVEVLACHRDGVLHPCAGTLPGVIAYPDLRTHRLRRKVHALWEILLTAGIAMVILLAASGWFAVKTGRLLATLRTSGDR